MNSLSEAQRLLCARALMEEHKVAQRWALKCTHTTWPAFRKAFLDKLALELGQRKYVEQLWSLKTGPAVSEHIERFAELQAASQESVWRRCFENQCLGRTMATQIMECSTPEARRK